MDSKFFLYQIIAVLFIWSGMAFFFNDLYPQGKIVFYVVTSWLLFLIVIYIRKIAYDRKQKQDEQDGK